MNLTKLYLNKCLPNWIPNNIFYYNSRTKKDEPFILTVQQQILIKDKSQYRLASCGRGIGKTEIIITESIGNSITKPGTNCLIIVPYSSHVQSIRQRIKDRIQSSPNIVEQFSRITPTEIIFNNGSKIKIRHYKDLHVHSFFQCNYLYIDEYFTMHSDLKSSIDYIMEKHPNIKILALGTPTARTARTNIDMRFNIHTLPSSDSSLMTGERLDYFRNSLTESAFFREMLGSLD